MSAQTWQMPYELSHLYHIDLYGTNGILSQDEKLRRVVESCGTENWNIVANFFTDRTDIQCQHRWQKVLNPELIKGPWTKEVSLYWQLSWVTIFYICVCSCLCFLLNFCDHLKYSVMAHLPLPFRSKGIYIDDTSAPKIGHPLPMACCPQNMTTHAAC